MPSGACEKRFEREPMVGTNGDIVAARARGAVVFVALSDEQRRFVQTVRDLAQREFRPRAARYMDGTFPWENMRALAELGVLGMAVPEEYGGLGLPVFDTALVLEEIAKVCYVTAMAVLGEVGVQTRIIATYAPEPIKRRILPAVCSGECLLAICMTEPDAGTDVANYRTNVDHVGNALRLNGVKTLISRADEAGMFVVFTRVDRRPGRAGIGCVLVEKGTPGFSVTGKFHTMGGENLHEIRFEDCMLPPENLVLEDGFRQLLSAFNTQRCLNPSISLGLAEGAFEEAVKYAKERQAFGRAIADFQGMRWKLAEMYRDIEASRSILYRACASADPFPDPLLAAAAKVTVNEMALRVTSEAIQVHGGYGFTDEFPVSRFYRGARYGTLGGGTSETLRDLIGKRVLAGIDPVDGIFGLGAF
jgi:alkylation response protein AidB-like acyl-CoA dehydrogenase